MRKKKVGTAHRRADSALLLAVLITVFGATAASAYSLYTANPFFVSSATIKTAEITQSPVELAAAQLNAERSCLAEAMYYEARGEGQEGQKAIAEVVLQRTHDLAFPKTICGVVHEGRQLRTGCQFSFMCDGSLAKPKNPIAWQASRQLAAKIMAGAVRVGELTGHAMFFHAIAVQPVWTNGMILTAQIGNHIFYRRDTTRGS